MPVAKSAKKQRNARFPVSSWSVYQRTLDDKTATNNPVECWHSSLTVLLDYFILFLMVKNYNKYTRFEFLETMSLHMDSERTT